MGRFLAAAVVLAAVLGGWLALLAVRSDRGSLAAGSDTGLVSETVARHTTRISAATAPELAAAVSQAAFPASSFTGRPVAVLLARPSDWQGMLAASRLMAPPFDAPLLLLNDDGTVPAATASELRRLSPRGVPLDSRVQAIVIGGDSADADATLDALGYRRRVIDGASATAIAAAIDDYRARLDGGYSRNVLIVSDQDSAYGLAAAGWAAWTGDAVLFTDPESLPDETRDRLSLRSRPSIYVLGPSPVVSDDVVRELGHLGPVQRIAGTDAAGTAVAFARFHDPAGGFGWNASAAGVAFVGVPFDESAAALPAAALSRVAGPLLPVSRIIAGQVREYLGALRPAPGESGTQRRNRALVVSPGSEVPDDVLVRLDALLHWEAGP